jgi:hypothetical protein
MPWVGFETFPASEQAKTVHALDRSATVTGHYEINLLYFYPLYPMKDVEYKLPYVSIGCVTYSSFIFPGQLCIIQL